MFTMRVQEVSAKGVAGSLVTLALEADLPFKPSADDVFVFHANGDAVELTFDPPRLHYDALKGCWVLEHSDEIDPAKEALDDAVAFWRQFGFRVIDDSRKAGE
jgi:hypothetical protein